MIVTMMSADRSNPQHMGYHGEPFRWDDPPGRRAQIRAELDGMIAHLYGLTEEEFAHILSTFPLVAEEVKSAAMEEFKKLG